MNTIILIKLIAAHLTGDFILQSDKCALINFRATHLPNTKLSLLTH